MKPVIGMGVTIIHYTDRDTATVVRVSKSGKTAWIVADKTTRIDDNGMSESQQYSYEPGDTKPIRMSLRKNGSWRLSGQFQNVVALGVRQKYHDYSF